MKIKNRFQPIVVMTISLLILSCGGTREEPVKTEPDPFPEPPPVVVTPPEETTEPEPVTPKNDIEKKPLVLQTIHFQYDKSNLTQEAINILIKNARQLQDNALANIRIEGHCDERGTVEYNLALGERRAMSARNYLVNFGVAPERISVISYGKERPVDPGHNSYAWNRNRRAEFAAVSR